MLSEWATNTLCRSLCAIFSLFRWEVGRLRGRGGDHHQLLTQVFIWQFNFGILPPQQATDKALQEPCLAICPNASRRRERGSRSGDIAQCPKA